VSEQISQSVSTRIDPFDVGYDEDELEQELDDLLSGTLPDISLTPPRSQGRVNVQVSPGILLFETSL